MFDNKVILLFDALLIISQNYICRVMNIAKGNFGNWAFQNQFFINIALAKFTKGF